ncbi:MAG: sigma-54 dependent transcriptional regulator [Candidatus Acidiferrales bacterium]
MRILKSVWGGLSKFVSMAAPGFQFASNGNNGSEELPSDAVIFGRSEAMRAIRQKVEKISATKVPVLLQGESGTGKELIARMIHRLSERAAGPFVKVNCPAIPGTLLESELFGYEKGSFTGAYGSKPGRAEMADRGTLFLDEISEMDLGLQAKLLQLLQDNQFWRIGAREETHVDVRIICATNRQLEDEIHSGRFRQDLFYRINVLKIQLPPLRERGEDLCELIEYFLGFFSRKHNVNPPAPSATLIRLLQKHLWPGNIRELSNLVERYAILGSEESVLNELLGAAEAAEGELEFPSSGPMQLKVVTRQTVQRLEKKIILRTLIAHRWNRKRAAKDLKISYRALLYKIRQAGLPSRRLAPATPVESLATVIPKTPSSD